MIPVISPRQATAIQLTLCVVLGTLVQVEALDRQVLVVGSSEIVCKVDTVLSNVSPLAFNR